MEQMRASPLVQNRRSPSRTVTQLRLPAGGTSRGTPQTPYFGNGRTDDEGADQSDSIRVRTICDLFLQCSQNCFCCSLLRGRLLLHPYSIQRRETRRFKRSSTPTRGYSCGTTS